MSKRIRFFRITSLLMLISGCVAMLTGIVFGLFLLLSNIIATDEIIHALESFAGLGIAFAALSGAAQIVTGIYSLKNINKPEKANTFIHLGALTAALFMITQVWDILSVGFHAYSGNAVVYIGMVIPAFYIISAVQHKAEEEPRGDGATELTKVIGFVEKRKERIFEILFTLILCGFIGWIFETVEVWIHIGRLTARGMLFISRINGFPIPWGLPLILMYGIGGAILIWCFKPLAKEPVRLFFVGMFVLTLFEYATAVFCEDVLGMKLWDYSTQFLNFQGRVCISSSLAWGILSVLSVKLFAPLFNRIYTIIKNKTRLHIIISAVMAFIIICYILRPFLNVEQY